MRSPLPAAKIMTWDGVRDEFVKIFGLPIKNESVIYGSVKIGGLVPKVHHAIKRLLMQGSV